MPPLAALRAFAAFAERGTLVGAGGTLGVSHAAVSQQIRSLEDHLGLPLVDRTGRKLELTEAGAVLAQACSEGFGNIARTVEDITGVSDARAVHVSTTPTFAASWLMPRLPAFQADHPGIKLLIDPTPKLAELSPGGIDLAIRYGVGPWGRYDCQMLLESPIVVVAAPSLIAGRPVGTPTDLACLPWLEELGTTESTTWLHRHGVEQGAVGAYMQMPGNLVLDAAPRGVWCSCLKNRRQGRAIIWSHGPVSCARGCAPLCAGWPVRCRRRAYEAGPTIKHVTLRACSLRQARSAVSRVMPTKCASNPWGRRTTLRSAPSNVAISDRAVFSKTFSAA